MKTFLRNNSLSIVMLGLFLIFLFGQAVTGFMVYNEDATQHGEAVIGFLAYLLSGHFGEAVFENWESEFLQMASYVLFTVFLIQRGSSESKDPNKKEATDADPFKAKKKPDTPIPVKIGGIALTLYKNSLVLALSGLFALSFALHAVEGSRQNCAEQIQHGQACDSLLAYITGPQFWFESFQNWQSEYLAVGALIVLSIYLRQQGSPESKPVAAPHSKTGND